MNAEWIPHPDKIWRYTTPTGEIIATMRHDPDTGHYKFGAIPLSANWNEAKAKCEALLAPKGKRK